MTAYSGRLNANLSIFTKAVIAICGLQMVQGSRIDLDRHLTDYYFSLRQLLDHTYDFQDYYPLPGYGKVVTEVEKPWPAEYLREVTLAKGKLLASNKSCSYSNQRWLHAGGESDRRCDAGIIFQSGQADDLRTALPPQELEPPANPERFRA